MTQIHDTQEEVTTIRTQSPPEQTIQKVIRTVEPEAKGAAPQKVYETKRTILRMNQIVWYILGIVEVLLVFRVVLKVLGADPLVGFTNLIYTITTPLTAPFAGILGSSVMGNQVIEWSTVFAALVYLCITWGFVYLMDLINPITPLDVARQ